MVAKKYIKMARGTFFQLGNIANRLLWGFFKLDTPYFLSRLATPKSYKNNFKYETGAKNVPSMKHLTAIFFFFMLFIYCKTTSNPLISTSVNKLMINYHSLCYFCGIVDHFGFYPPNNYPMNI